MPEHYLIFCAKNTQSKKYSEKIVWQHIKNVFSFNIHILVRWWFKFNFRHFLGGNCIFLVCAMFYKSKRACFLFVIFWAACLIRPLFSGNNCPHTVESVFDIFSQQRKAYMYASFYTYNTWNFSIKHEKGLFRWHFFM